MLSTDLLIHATGVCALALNVIALVRTCEKKLRVQSGLAGVIWALNNLLLGAHTAAALSLVSAGRTATSAMTLQAAERLRRGAFLAFVLVTLVVSAFTWKGWGCGAIAVASIMSTYAMFYMRGRALRWSMLASSILWMVNAWTYDSWEQLLANAATAAAALYGARRAEQIKAEVQASALPRHASTPSSS